MKILTTKFLFPLLLVTSLAACSSKPDTADIQKELAEAFNCPILELSEVKKVDGAEIENKQYDAAFTYTLSIKGGQPAATNLFAEWLFLADQLQLADKAFLRARMEQLGEQKEEEIAEIKQKINARIGALMPCTTPLADSRARMMFTEFALAVKSGQDKIAIPLAEKIHGVGRMGKAESGWRFVGMPNLTLTEIVKSEPVAYPKFKPLVIEEPVQGNIADANKNVDPSAGTGSLPELPPFKKGEKYASVRAKMISAGWKPFHSPSADSCPADDTRCNGRPEMESCAGSSQANCKFLWKKDEQTIAICTLWEDPEFDNICTQ